MGCVFSRRVANNPQQEIRFQDKYELADVWETGAYGAVHVTYTVDTNEELAVKILDLNNGKKPERQLRKDARNEETAWARIGEHPNVVGLRECLIEDRFAYFVMEFCPCPLFATCKAESDLSEYAYAQYFKQMAQALAHIHSVGVVHRDVKQDNFLLGAPDGNTVKLCDFGLSAVIVGHGTLSDKVGTPPYMAPEMLTGCKYGASVDVWSFGVIVYTTFFGCWPYQPRVRTAKEMMMAIREGTVQPSFAPKNKALRNVVSRGGTRFVKALLNRDPLTRPSAASCLEMAYLSEEYRSLLQASRKNEGSVSFAPQFLAALQCGAFKARAPKEYAGRQFHLMQPQSTTPSRRGSCSSGRDGTMRSQTAPANAVIGTDPMPTQPGLLDIQDHEPFASTEEVEYSTATSNISTSDADIDNRNASIDAEPV